jgi:hypothetical protein
MKGSNDIPVVELKKVSKIYKTKAAFFGTSGKDVVALNQLSLITRKSTV